MRLLPLIALLGLVACDAAGPGFSRSAKVQRVVDGSQFTLRRQGDVVEAIRTSSELLPRFQVIGRRAAIAAWQGTGCTPSWVLGDPAMMWVGLSCDGRPAPQMPKRPRLLECAVFDAGQGALDVLCGG